MSDSTDLNTLDTSTITGAIEYIVGYSKATWNVPVVFYTGTKYESENYEKMVKRLYEIQEKWDIGIIDLWDDLEMNQVSEKDYALYMVDPVHPSKAGYLKWWTPKMEEFLYDYVGK